MFQAQARECLFEKLELQSRDGRNIDVCLDLAQEAAQVRCLHCDDNFQDKRARLNRYNNNQCTGRGDIQRRPRIDIARASSWLRPRDLDLVDIGEARTPSRSCSQAYRGRSAGQTDRRITCGNQTHLGAHPEERREDAIGRDGSQGR